VAGKEGEKEDILPQPSGYMMLTNVPGVYGIVVPRGQEAFWPHQARQGGPHIWHCIVHLCLCNCQYMSHI
jgi:hypothetical protein